MVCIACSLNSGNIANDSSPEQREADIFLAGMPRGMQEHQAEAIHKAISGNRSMLADVRNSRNIPSVLPQDISRTVINERMALFRSSRYDNDTIPLLVYFHGGGWVIGSINSCSRYCGALAEKGVAVLAVDYMLAPEHPFPAGLNDCVDAVGVAIGNMEKWRCGSISVGGDSSGGNLAIATAMSFPANTFSSLVLFYPVTKAYADNSDSWNRYGRGFGLDSDLMNAFNKAYSSSPYNPLVSPGEAQDSALMKLPPTLMVAAQRDILRCQGSEFARRLTNLGIETKYILIPGSVHLFITVEGQPTAFHRSVKESSEFIIRHIGRVH